MGSLTAPAYGRAAAFPSARSGIRQITRVPLPPGPGPIRSEPAGSVSVSTQPGDPDWGMYSVLMDSAYYNYARQVTGMFGLVPPPEKTVLAYQGV